MTKNNKILWGVVVASIMFVCLCAGALGGSTSDVQPTQNLSSIQTSIVGTTVAQMYTENAPALTPDALYFSAPQSTVTTVPTVYVIQSDISPIATQIVVSSDSMRLFSSESLLALRDAPSVSGNVILRLAYNDDVFSLEDNVTTLSKIGVENQWLQVYHPYTGNVGFVAAWYLSSVVNQAPVIEYSAPASDHPAGATAKCKDGTYSYSKSRSGTCSGHKGVLIWYP